MQIKIILHLIVFSTLITINNIRDVMAIEEPKFEVVRNFDAFELRKYPPLLIAEVTVSGDRGEASSAGFRKIADFIFGNNTGVGKQSKIDMTVPVVVEPIKIEMTAPVTIQASSNEKSWKVQFVMPSQFTLESLPKPNNEEVKIVVVPEKYYAVIKFSGFTGDESVAENTTYLKAWMARERLTAIGLPRLARYNPPWTLPFWRRNEIQIEVTP
ncbi:SOUL heme-binding protein [Polynucleobacter kasalickyi]|uniref:SOUL heme-binding protein n=2 Tax=Polynucleobacter kasalickyi TaxID=1938817 RepID=A0A1W1YK51_9BURK|nr:SOUL heme-binding protein [Polynucleobacter kasalickyi]